MADSFGQIEKYRAKILVNSLYGISLLFIIGLVLLNFSSPVKPIAVFVYVTMVSCMVILAMLIHRKTLSYKIGANGFLAILTAAIVLITLYGSGFLAPALSILILVPDFTSGKRNVDGNEDQ